MNIDSELWLAANIGDVERLRQCILAGGNVNYITFNVSLLLFFPFTARI